MNKLKMLKGKKGGDQVAIITAMVLFMGLLTISYFLVDKNAKYETVSKGMTIGERQFGLFLAYADGEKALFYADEASRLAVKNAFYTLAKKGGYATAPQCGEYDGVALWKKAGEECYPDSNDANKNYYEELDTELEKYYASYQEAKIPVEYSYTIKEGKIIGLAKEEIIIKSSPSKDAFTYKIKPSFKQKFSYDFKQYDSLQAKAKEMAEKCAGAADLGMCIETFNGQDANGIKIDVGCGKTPRGEAVKICAKSKDAEYMFALAEDPGGEKEIETIKQMAKKYDVPEEIALKVAAVESGYTFSHTDKSGNVKTGDGGCSYGIMQINTCANAHPSCKGTITYDASSKDLCTGAESCAGTTIEDMNCNIEAGIRYLKHGYADYEDKTEKGTIASIECYSCSGKYTGWQYAMRFYNGCKCSQNNYVELASNADVSEFLV